MTNSINEVLEQDVIFITGSNTTENHPVIGAKMRQAKQRGAKIIVADPRKIDLAKQADIHLQLTPGTNIALYNGMLNVIIKEGLLDKNFIESRTEGFEEIKELVSEYDSKTVAEICGIREKDLIEAARLYATADKAGIYYAMGVTQFATGTQGVMALSNLALSVGKIGKKSCGINPLRGQNNVQGACDMGALPGDFPGYQKVANEDSRKKFSEFWGAELSKDAGITLTEMFDHAGDSIRFMYIVGENSMISDPDSNHLRHQIEKLDFLVVQDIFLTETAEFADVVLPAAAFAEKDGTFSNTERRVQRVRKAIEAPGVARADWQIFADIMERMGYENNFSNASEIFDEIASCVPTYAGINYERLEDLNGIQWPCRTKEDLGTEYMHQEKFSTPNGRAQFKPTRHVGLDENTDEEYPIIFTTGRILYQYHTRTMTGKTDAINEKAGSSYIEINPKDAEKLYIKNGDRINVGTRRGELVTTAKVTSTVEEGVVFMPFHFIDARANILTNKALDAIAKIPELKACACKIWTE